MNFYNKSDIPVDLQEYFCPAEIGLEQTPEEYVAKLVEVFREVRRVLRDDGTLWLNLGDSYSGSGKGPAGNLGKIHNEREIKQTSGIVPDGLKPKDLIGIPWRAAFALQADGWWLRQDIIWSKPNPMPESVTDRCTKAHEYVFLLSKSARYYFDQKAVAEPVTQSTIERLSQPNLENQIGSDRVPGKTNGNMKAKPPRFGGDKYGDDATDQSRTKSGNDYTMPTDGKRNKRSVWTVATQPYKEAHFATFPPKLISPMILAGCPVGGTVLDPFGGSGTTGEVAERYGRNSILIELNPAYIELQKQRTAQMGLGL